MRRPARSILVAVGLLATPAAGWTQDCCAIFEPGPLPPLSVNQVVHVPVKVTNTGDVTWSGAGKTEWFLSYMFTRPGSSWVGFGPPVLFPRNVPKGDSVTLDVRMQAPFPAGTYVLKWLVQTTLFPTTDWTHYGSTFDQTVEVSPSLLYLKALLSVLAGTPPPPDNPSATMDLSPVIESVAGGSYDPTTVGDYITVARGRRFDGNAAGRLVLNFGDGTEWATTSYWTDTQANAFFSIAGRVDQQAALQLVRADGVRSNEFPVLFRARRDYQKLPPGSVQIECATAGYTTDRCWAGTAEKRDYLAASHASYCCITGDSGTDTYALPTLLNGWKYDRLLFNQRGNPDGASASYSGFTPGPAGHTVSVDWSAPLGELVTYTFLVYITGPLGVPYR